jgi:hypothetical protein
MNNDLKDFIESSEAVPSAVYNRTLKYLEVSLNPKPLLLKFYCLNLIGALLTVTICPQYGFGPMGGELGFISSIMHMGPIWCGLFCATIFFAGGNILSYLFLNSFERNWIMKHKYGVILPYISLTFFAGMVLKQIAPGEIHHNVLSFYMSWFFGAILISMSFYQLLSKDARI